MAFGKDSRVLQNILAERKTLQQSAAQSTHRPRGGGGGKGGMPLFIDKYVPSTEKVDTVRLVAGEYLQDVVVGEGKEAVVAQTIEPFIKVVNHFDGARQRSSLCSAGPFANSREHRQPCHACDIYWATSARDSNGRWKSSRMSKNDQFVFSVFDYSDYHKMPVIDKQTGQVKMSATTKQPYFNWVKCSGQGCDACRGNIEKKQGEMRHWPLNYTQFQTLISADRDIGSSCVTCGSIDSIVSHGWMCKGCGEAAIDMSTTTLKSAELREQTQNLHTCADCGHEGFLEEVYDCPVCAQKQAGAPVRASLFDVDLRVKLVDTGAMAKTLQIMGYSPPGKPVEPFLSQMKPIDLVTRYAPDSLEQQAEKFGVVPNPGAGPSEQPAARAYNNPYGNRTPQ